MNSYSLYADKFFEDHSGMFFLDYDGYGTGMNGSKKKRRRYLTYGMKDWLLGFEYHRRADSWLNTIVLELHLFKVSKVDQSITTIHKPLPTI